MLTRASIDVLQAVSESRRLQQVSAPPAGLPSGASAQLTALDRMRMRSSQLGANVLPDQQHTADDTSGGASRAAAETSARSSLPKPIDDGGRGGGGAASAAAGHRVRDPKVRTLLVESMKDKAKERRQLETDMTKGNYDAEARIMAAKRILELDRQALELQHRLAE